MEPKMEPKIGTRVKIGKKMYDVLEEEVDNSCQGCHFHEHWDEYFDRMTALGLDGNCFVSKRYKMECESNKVIFQGIDPLYQDLLTLKELTDETTTNSNT